MIPRMEDRPKGTESSCAGSTAGAKARPQVVDRHTIHRGRKFDFESMTVRRPSGRVTQHEYVRHPGAVVIVPVLPDGRLVLIRNDRVAVGERLWEFCAGTIEAGEPPERCAARELIEETGYRAARLESLGWFYTTPGLTDERMHAFVAVGLEHVGQALEEDESISVETLPIDGLLSMADSGEFRDGKSLVALFLAMRRGLIPGGTNSGAPSAPPQDRRGGMI